MHVLTIGIFCRGALDIHNDVKFLIYQTFELNLSKFGYLHANNREFMLRLSKNGRWCHFLMKVAKLDIVL